LPTCWSIVCLSLSDIDLHHLIDPIIYLEMIWSGILWFLSPQNCSSDVNVWSPRTGKSISVWKTW
jgi:hypothetical protein